MGVSGTERAAGAQPSYQTLENPIQRARRRALAETCSITPGPITRGVSSATRHTGEGAQGGSQPDFWCCCHWHKPCTGASLQSSLRQEPASSQANIQRARPEPDLRSPGRLNGLLICLGKDAAAGGRPGCAPRRFDCSGLLPQPARSGCPVVNKKARFSLCLYSYLGLSGGFLQRSRG